MAAVYSVWRVDGQHVALEQEWDRGCCRLSFLFSDGLERSFSLTGDEMRGLVAAIEQGKQVAMRSGAELKPTSGSHWTLAIGSSSRRVDHLVLRRLLPNDPLGHLN